MRLFSPSILGAAIALTCASTSYAAPVQPLDLDFSFSADGLHQQNYGITVGTPASYFTDVAVTPDDKILAVGHAKRNSSQYEGIIVKYTNTGALDNTFGTNGIARHHTLSNSLFHAVVVQADGKIIVTGRSRAHGDWQLIVMRLNTDGTLDTSFATAGVYTTRYPNTTTSPRVRPSHGNLIGHDVAINSTGDIFITANQYTGRTLNMHRYVGHVIKLDSQGVLDTGFGYKGLSANNGKTSIGHGDQHNYSTRLTKLTLDANDNMYVTGQWSYATSGNAASDPLHTLMVNRIESNGQYINQSNPFSSQYNRWALHQNVRFSTNTEKQILNSAIVLPSGDIVSAGCDASVAANPIRIQRQTNTGTFATGFGTNGIVTTGYVNASDCIDDMGFHPEVGLLTVGNADTSPIISAFNKDTGAQVATNTLNVTGELKAVATLASGKIVAVGHTTGTIESLISVFHGRSLTNGSTPVINDLTATSQSNVPLNNARLSSTKSVTITPSVSLTAQVIDGQAIINSATPVSGQVTLRDGDNIRLRNTASSEPETDTTTKLIVDRGTGFSHNNKSWKPTDHISTFKITTLAADTTPDAFSLQPTGLSPIPRINSVSTSGTATITGINTAVPVSITAGAEYSIHRAGVANAEAYTSANGTVREGDKITVRHTNSSNFSTQTSTTLTVGQRNAFYRTTTEAIDTLPQPFSLGGDTLNAGLNQVIISNHTITVSGINAPAPIGITNGEYSINNGPYTSAAGTVNNGDIVRTRHTSASTFSTTTTLSLGIGGRSDSLKSITMARDTVPSAFSFPAQTNTALSTLINSGQINVSGINSSSAISITNGEYRINNSNFTSAAGTVNNGDTVEVRHTSSANLNETTTSTLTIGGISGSFTSTTIPSIIVPRDTTPDAFTFPSQTNVALSTVVNSGATTITGIDAVTSITITNGEYSVNGGNFTASNGTLSNGDTINIRHTSSSQNSTTNTTQINVGGVTSLFETTTIAASVPAPPTGPTDSKNDSGGGSVHFLLLLASGLLIRRKKR